MKKQELIISNKKSSILDNTKTIDQINSQINELEKIDYKDEKVLQLESEIELNKKEKEKINDKILEINSQIASLNSKNEMNRQLELKMANLEICPTCLQNVDAVYRANIMNNSHSDTSENNRKIESLNYDKKNISDKLEIINLEISSKEKEFTDLRILKIKLEGIREKRERFIEIKQINSSLEKDIEMLTQHIDSLNKSVLDLSGFDSMFEEKQRELLEAQSEERSAEIKVAELKKEIEVFSKQIKELRDRLKKMEELKEKLVYLSELEGWLVKELNFFNFTH